ncbi:MAG: hypothetical protein C0436_03090 [Alphaproteobacteria bacterium]|nr:hypothetical protein [Alphaproteobacteria bacterium]
MEQTQKAQEIRQRLDPPDEANVSMVLNGVGNGMMLGAAPFLALEMYSGITGKPVSAKAHKINAFAVIAGCALGGWFGVKEASKIHNYRLAIGNEIAKLNDRIDTAEAKRPTRWADKLEAEQSTPTTEPSRG